MRDLATRDPDVERRATALLAVMKSNPVAADDLLAEALTCDSLPLRQVAAMRRVDAGERSDVLLGTLMSALVEEASVDRQWTDLATPVLIGGWKGDEGVRDRLLALTHELPRHHVSGQLSRSTIDYLLTSMFPGDPVVGGFLASHFAERFPFIGFSHRAHFWRLLASNFRNDPALVEAIDKWLPEHGEHAEVDGSYAAMLGGTQVGKDLLLRHNRESSVPHWSMSALIERWGLEDPDVRDALAWRLADPSRASAIAYLVVEFEPDRARARELLLQILRAPSVRRRDFALNGFLTLGVDRDDDEVLEAIFALRDAPDWSSELAEYAMLTVSWDPRARKIALETLRDPEGFWGSAAHVFSNDPEIRTLVLSRLTPLDAFARLDLVESILRSDGTDAVVRNRFELYAADQDANVATTAAIGYYGREAARDGLDAQKPRLVGELERGGINHEERAQAAFAAALHLGIPEVLRDAEWRWGKDGMVSVPLAHIYTPNYPLVRGVLENWDELHEMFGDDFSRRFSQFGDDEESVWAQLAVGGG